MIVTCLNCNKQFEKSNSQIKRSPNNYCSKSCSCSSNNKKYPKRFKTKKCKCGELILSDRKKCPNCISKFDEKNYTLEQCIYDKHHQSSAYALVRSRARTTAKKQGWKSCIKCGYDKHIEVAHIKPISEFKKTDTLSIINDPKNLLPLCPNCHWEFDNIK